MEHTFILQAGGWAIEGEFIDEQGRRAKFEGGTVIRHEAALWHGDSWSQKTGEPASHFENHYLIQPFLQGAPATTWTCAGTAGRSTGRFVLVDDALFSCGRSEDGRNEIVECLTQLSENSYRGYSLLIRDGGLQLTMTALLTRTAQTDDRKPPSRA